MSYWWKTFFQHPLIRAGCLYKGRGGKSSSFNWYAPPAWMALSPQRESWAMLIYQKNKLPIKPQSFVALQKYQIYKKFLPHTNAHSTSQYINLNSASLNSLEITWNFSHSPLTPYCYLQSQFSTISANPIIYIFLPGERIDNWLSVWWGWESVWARTEPNGLCTILTWQNHAVNWIPAVEQEVGLHLTNDVMIGDLLVLIHV